MRKSVLDYVIENPTATNREIADNLGIPYNNAKSYISKLKKAGLLNVNVVKGIRHIDVDLNRSLYSRSKENDTSVYREELNENLKKVADKIVETILLESRTELILESGRLYVKIYDRLL